MCWPSFGTSRRYTTSLPPPQSPTLTSDVYCDRSPLKLPPGPMSIGNEQISPACTCVQAGSSTAPSQLLSRLSLQYSTCAPGLTTGWHSWVVPEHAATPCAHTPGRPVLQLPCMSSTAPLQSLSRLSHSSGA